MLERLNVPYYKKSLEMCFNVAYHLIGQNHRSGGYIAVNTSPALFRAVLHPESITDSMIEYRSSEGSTLLHLVAYAMNACYVSYRYKERDRTQRRTELKNDFLGKSANSIITSLLNRKQVGEHCYENLLEEAQSCIIVIMANFRTRSGRRYSHSCRNAATLKLGTSGSLRNYYTIGWRILKCLGLTSSTTVA